jgi:hypothetical protein
VFLYYIIHVIYVKTFLFNNCTYLFEKNASKSVG